MAKVDVYHDSRVAFCRSPFGAACCGSAVRLCLLSRQALDNAVVRLWRESQGEQLIPLVPAGQWGSWQRYVAELVMPADPGLLWYYFIYNCQGKQHYYGCRQGRTGGWGKSCDTEPPSYQLTVARADFRTPQWLKDGIMYQIFVDRFYRPSGSQPPAGQRDALLHLAWDDPPFYCRDSQTGEVVAYDYFGGTLAGVQEQLPYLLELGVNVIYFNPVFMAASNHKYDTADYHQIDPAYGSNEKFQDLCREFAANGISVILDGVFSHTGSDSIYFNKEGHYPQTGACQSKTSPYYSWYRFSDYPGQYASWWDGGNLPEVDELDDSYLDFMVRAKDSVVADWLRRGARGWRLDVADELPDAFIRQLRRRVKAENSQAAIIGEVWEDASHKRSYGVMREYLGGDELDSVMNYPFRDITSGFLLGRVTAGEAAEALLSLAENYPPEVFYSLMNLIGSHDVPRILTVLGEAAAPETLTAAQQARYRLPAAAYERAVKRLKLLVLWQMAFPGMPAVYYGDEAGAEGYADPFNRGTYPWGRENHELLAWYKKLIRLRRENTVLRTGRWQTVYANGDVYCFKRWIVDRRDVFNKPAENNFALIAFNRSPFKHASITVSGGDSTVLYDMLNGRRLRCRDGRVRLFLEPLAGCLLMNRPQKPRRRRSGVLLPVFSLPGADGIGDFGRAAYGWIDFLVQAGQHLWQILPLNPPDEVASPYQALSAFAGNPLFISLEDLCRRQLLTIGETGSPPDFSAVAIDYAKVRQWKEPLLYIAFKRFRPDADYEGFVAANSSWLEDYALFMALKQYYAGKPWYEWDDEALVTHDEDACQKYRQLLADTVACQKFIQYIWHLQWQALKSYASRNDVQIIGDLPLFVAYDSSDVWSRQELFRLDGKHRPQAVAGVPPDYFAAAGQLWGNPLYDWEAMAADGFSWWGARIKRLGALVDSIRLDHFRGYEAYWAIPAGAVTAAEGHWEKGPGMALFTAVQHYCSAAVPHFIAEDLGVITPEVEALRHVLQLPGMGVLQFALQTEGVVLPDSPHTVLYTGTHDNDTLWGWFQALPTEAKRRFSFIDTESPQAVCRYFCALLLRRTARSVIIPIADILALGSEARINTPGTTQGNWQWRLASLPAKQIAAGLQLLTRHCRR